MTTLLKIKLTYKSQFSNGYPLIRCLINSKQIICFEANSHYIEFTTKIDKKINLFQIEHFGKNYLTDNNPDKFFELIGCEFNDIPLDEIIWDFVQKPITPPWDVPIDDMKGNLYLGHNGVLELFFENPVHIWLKNKFSKQVNPMNSQKTTREVLDIAKKKFNL